MVKNPPANAGDAGDVCPIPVSGRSSGIGNGNLLQYSCLENPMDGGVWQATVHRAAKSWTQLSNWAYIHAIIHRYSCSLCSCSLVCPWQKDLPILPLFFF